MTAAAVRPDTRFEPIEDRELGVYCLRLRETPKGRFYVEYAQWWLWGGKVAAMNPHRVSSFFWKRERTREFCMAYTAQHPGCKTAEQARAIADGAAPREERRDV